jgi:hypothetical protein
MDASYNPPSQGSGGRGIGGRGDGGRGERSPAAGRQGRHEAPARGKGQAKAPPSTTSGTSATSNQTTMPQFAKTIGDAGVTPPVAASVTQAAAPTEQERAALTSLVAQATAAYAETAAAPTKQLVPDKVHDDDANSTATAPAGNTTTAKCQLAPATRGRSNDPKARNSTNSSAARMQASTPAPFEWVQPPQRYVARYSIKVHLEKAPDKQGAPRDVLLMALGEIVDKLHELDTQLLFYPFLQGDQLPITNRLLRSDQLMRSDKGLKRFFFNVSPRRNGGNLYVEVLMGSSKPWSELESELDFWLKDHQHGMWMRVLQHEKTIMLGWLLFSHSNLHFRALASAASEHLGFPVDFRYRMI